MSTVISLLGMVVAIQAGAPVDNRSIVVEKMKAFAFLIGEWEGNGNMRVPSGATVNAKVKESVQFRLSGNAILIEGLGTAKVFQGGPDQIVHESLAMITWDPKLNKYVMHAMTARAGAVEPTIELTDKSLIWSYDREGGGKIRFTIKISDKGLWIEDGEFSQDGNTWNKFFEMTLSKK